MSLSDYLLWAFGMVVLLLLLVAWGRVLDIAHFLLLSP